MASKKSHSPARQADVARKIWLAGIGAYGRAFSEAQESLAKMTGGSSKLFDELVEKGEEIEHTVEERGREIAERVRASTPSIDDRIRAMRERLQAGYEDTSRSSAIEARLDAIEDKIDQLLAATQKPPAKNTTKRKTASKKSV